MAGPRPTSHAIAHPRRPARAQDAAGLRLAAGFLSNGPDTAVGAKRSPAAAASWSSPSSHSPGMNSGSLLRCRTAPQRAAGAVPWWEPAGLDYARARGLDWAATFDKARVLGLLPADSVPPRALPPSGGRLSAAVSVSGAYVATADSASPSPLPAASRGALVEARAMLFRGHSVA